MSLEEALKNAETRLTEFVDVCTEDWHNEVLNTAKCNVCRLRRAIERDIALIKELLRAERGCVDGQAYVVEDKLLEEYKEA